MKELFVIGAGGHSKTVISIAQANDHQILGVLDQARDDDERILDVPLIGDRFSYVSYLDRASFFVAIGDNHERREFFQAAENRGGESVSLLHPQASIHESSEIGTGTVVANGATVCPNSSIGKNVIINSRALIEHDAKIGDHAHIGPDVSLAGRVEVGEGSFVGIKTVVKDNIKIGKWCKIGAGSVVVANVPDGCTVTGNPGRIVSVDHFESFSGNAPETVVFAEDSLKKGLERIDYWGTGYAVVIDSNRICLGVITDGMIRRFLLQGRDIDMPVKDAMNPEFVCIKEGEESEAPHFLSKRNRCLPVLDGEGRLIKILHRSDFFKIPSDQTGYPSKQLVDLFEFFHLRSANSFSLEMVTDSMRGLLGEDVIIAGDAQEVAERIFGLENLDKLGDWWTSDYTSQSGKPVGKGDVTQADSKGFFAMETEDLGEIFVTGELSKVMEKLNVDPELKFFLRACPGDEFNLEGGAVLINLGIKQNDVRPPHPLQIASSKSALRNLCKEKRVSTEVMAQ